MPTHPPTHPPFVNLASLVRVAATFDATSWPDVCTFCGSSAEHLSDTDPHGRTFTDGRVYCARCDGTGWPDSAPDPAERSGWCDPCNPWGTLSWADTEPTYRVLTFADAVDMVREFPGSVWDYADSDAEQDIRTGEYVRVCLHVYGPAADLVLSAASVCDT